MNDNVRAIETDRRKEHQRQQLVIALLQHPSLEKAAKSVGISPVTAWRISKSPEFQEEYRQVRRDAFQQSLALLQQAGSIAVSTLLKIMRDPSAPAAARVHAAEFVLRHAAESFEAEELAARVQSIEQWMKQMAGIVELPRERSSH
jgi:hypothetical protein